MTNENTLTTINKIREELLKHKEIIESRLAISNIGKDWKDYANDVVYSVSINEELAKCSVQSIINCALQAAKYALPLGGNVANLVGNGGKVRFEIGYEGYPILITRIIPIKYKIAGVLFEGDELIRDKEKERESFTPEGVLDYKANFTIKRSGKKDKIIGAYALIALMDGNSFFLHLTSEEIVKFKPTKWTGEAGKKTKVAMETPFWKDWNEKMNAKVAMKELGRNVYRIYSGTTQNEYEIEAMGNDENEEMNHTTPQINKFDNDIETLVGKSAKEN